MAKNHLCWRCLLTSWLYARRRNRDIRGLNRDFGLSLPRLKPSDLRLPPDEFIRLVAETYEPLLNDRPF
jgi:hypothetical protein